MNFLIIEDDVLISEHLKYLIQEEGHLVTDICSNEASALNSLKNQQPDLAFVDIRLQGNDSGVIIASELTKLNIPFYFITSFSDKKTVQEAVETLPKGYILKPFEVEEIQDAIGKLISFVDREIDIKVNGADVFIKCSDVIYMRSENVYVEIYTLDKKYVIREKLGEIVNRIGLKNFIRVHRSFALDLERVTQRKKNCLTVNTVDIPVSKKYEDSVNQFFQQKTL
ncbi:MAG: response regulator transcription factor [Crocinitomicaceae bacterium]